MSKVDLDDRTNVPQATTIASTISMIIIVLAIIAGVVKVIGNVI